VQIPPTKGPAARTKDSPAIALLKRIKAEAEIRLQAVRDFLNWQRTMHHYSTQDPAVLLAQERKVFKFYWDMAEDQLEADERLRRLDAPPARQKLDQVYKGVYMGPSSSTPPRPCPSRRSRSSRLEPKVGSEVVRKGLMWRRSQHFQQT
jgi:hypothetical protein